MATKAYSPSGVDDLGQQSPTPRKRRNHRSHHRQPITKWVSFALAYVVVIGLTLAFLYFVLQNT